LKAKYFHSGTRFLACLHVTTDEVEHLERSRHPPIKAVELLIETLASHGRNATEASARETSVLDSTPEID